MSYFIIMDTLDSNGDFDTFCGEHESLQAAKDAAKSIWSHLTSTEKVNRYIDVLHATGEDAGKPYRNLSISPRFAVDLHISFTLTPSQLHDLENDDLLFIESDMDFNDGDILSEIFCRAETALPGITQRYTSAVNGDSDEYPDDIKQAAIRVLSQKEVH